MPIPKKLLNYLEENKIKYEEISHRIVYTAWDLAKTLHLKKPEEAVKTLILKTDNDHVLVLLPSHKNLDKAKFQKVLNKWRRGQDLKLAKKIDFVKEAWMKKNIKVGKLGAVPPFGKLLGWPVFADNSILKPAKIIVNAGDYGVSLKIRSKDLIKLEEPVRGSFSKKR